ncbi:MAG: prepilin peptidase [Pseudobdellovibrionaceae bacterium]|nr:prepilin peptidase [Bdellovibrionales bacterium]USN49061.1 MAG: prepilin peptidase [Pseudobdellovibrionaceae bacterium]
MGVATFVVFLFGAIWGSFANVVIYRLPHEKSVVKPRSRCPKCEAAIKWYDNVPILSWLFLRGRCRSCKAKISWRYPLVEFLMGSVFAIVFYQFGFSWLTLEYLVFAFGLIVVSFIDFDHMILPDVFTLSGVVLGLLGAALNPEREFMSALWGVLMGGGSLYLVAYIYFALRKEEGMGGGDIKLLAWIGALLGWKSIPFVILASSLVGSVVGILIMIRSREGMKAAIPFGPYLALGALIYMIGGSQLIDWYFRLHIPSLGQ